MPANSKKVIKNDKINTVYHLSRKKHVYNKSFAMFHCLLQTEEYSKVLCHSIINLVKSQQENVIVQAKSFH